MWKEKTQNPRAHASTVSWDGGLGRLWVTGTWWEVARGTADRAWVRIWVRIFRSCSGAGAEKTRGRRKRKTSRMKRMLIHTRKLHTQRIKKQTTNGRQVKEKWRQDDDAKRNKKWYGDEKNDMKRKAKFTHFGKQNESRCWDPKQNQKKKTL